MRSAATAETINTFQSMLQNVDGEELMENLTTLNSIKSLLEEKLCKIQDPVKIYLNDMDVAEIVEVNSTVEMK